MRIVLLTTLSAALLSACITTQENPNYEFSSKYKGEAAETNQYAQTVPSYGAATTTSATYETAPTQPVFIQQPVGQATANVSGIAPTDSTYGARAVNGTPGFMALESNAQAGSPDSLAPALPSAQMVATAPLAAAGTPIEYDYSGNLIVADVATTGSQLPDTVRILPRVGQQGIAQNTLGQAYIVQPGDTVYSLSRRTCVGVNVIQSMNGLSANYGINIGQKLTLPTSVC